MLEENKTALLELRSERQMKENRIITGMIKRLVDIVFGVMGVIFLIPLTILIYIVKKILKEDKGPIFYDQLRIGKNGKNFKLYKFRTMVTGADEILKKYLDENEEAKKEYEENHKLKNDPRITKLGNFLRKTSLDEVPQFINILIGNMSLIGPRPYLPREKEQMGKYYSEIIKCKPGITGLWQVSGRSEMTFEERVKIESLYVSNNSLKTDAKIMVKTVQAVLKKEGAF